jgi:hypothetical protein
VLQLLAKLETLDMSDKKLFRSMDDRMFFGVASGLAHYLNVDPVLVRLFFVLNSEQWVWPGNLPGHGGVDAC